ncbi:glyceraldehyde-3-phosphate dehydrogenase-like [Trichosurus vulpecula]|uniref:glyceraldehyde-3-phosphate dehydrogenase-like n=1 Tax=Trichosurus vulpecula TaxID=9337 RepID=UPI00186AD66F|nr:glyceraldehyde-3-phosphate dehydrogenase-like [Trichosurus vulpecula]
MTTLALWKDSWPQYKSLLVPRRQEIDGPSGKLWYEGYGTAQNIIFTSLDAALAVSEVIPEWNGKLIDKAFHVPTTEVSVADLACCLETPNKYDDIKKVVKRASVGRLKGILGPTAREIDFKS